MLGEHEVGGSSPPTPTADYRSEKRSTAPVAAPSADREHPVAGRRDREADARLTKARRLR